MKKIACLLIAALLLCLACSGLAENAPFTLRSGVRFGDAQKDVEAVETWEKISGVHIFSKHGTLLGVDSMLSYSFSQDRLTRAMYTVGTVYSENGTTRYADQSHYLELFVYLSMKYGNPVSRSNSDWGIGDPTLSVYLAYLSAASDEGKADFETLLPDPSTAKWVIRSGDETVLIQLVEHEVRQGGEKRYFTLLDYFSVDAETLALCKTYLSEL